MTLKLRKELAKVEALLAAATEIFNTEFTEQAYLYQQQLVRRRLEILRELRPTPARKPDRYVPCKESKSGVVGVYDNTIQICPVCKGRSRWFKTDTCPTCHNTGKIQ